MAKKATKEQIKENKEGNKKYLSVKTIQIQIGGNNYNLIAGMPIELPECKEVEELAAAGILTIYQFKTEKHGGIK
jgi:hypothetical protein